MERREDGGKEDVVAVSLTRHPIYCKSKSPRAIGDERPIHPPPLKNQVLVIAGNRMNNKGPIRYATERVEGNKIVVVMKA